MTAIEIFRAGTYPQGVYTAEDIKAIAENYDPKFMEAPLTFDHDQTGPAFGWVDKVYANGDVLLAEFKDVNEYVKYTVDSKQFKDVSVELADKIDGKTGPYLWAVTLLGAQRPAVKGLNVERPLQFSDKQINVLKFGTVENKTTPKSDSPTDLTSKSMDELIKMIKDTQDSLKQANEKADANAQKIKEIQSQPELKDIDDFVNEQIEEGKILPAQKADVLEVFASLSQVKKFSDGKDSLKPFKDLISKLPKQPILNEFAGQCNSTIFSAQDLAKKAQKYQDEAKAKGQTVSFSEAIQAVKKGE